MAAAAGAWDHYEIPLPAFGNLYLIFADACTTLGLLAGRKEKTMHDNQQEQQRVLGRSGARILTREEADRIQGGQNRTFAFTHVITDDIIRD